MAEDPRPRLRRMAVSAKFERMVQRAIGPRLDALEREIAQTRAIAASALDAIPDLRRQLVAARASADYEAAFTDPDPLVTVRIPTFQRSKLLVERSLPSVLKQTHQNFEIIVVGDGCTDDTAERIDELGDPRIRFINLPFRFPYPEEPDQRWQVAGAPGANLATEMARGSWLALLGDDDEMEPHHLESLLDVARSTRSEMVYGNIRELHLPPRPDATRSRYPPEHGFFNFQAGIYLRALRFFEFNVTSWVVQEPSDWNMCRRMIEAGVRIGHADTVVVTWYPSREESGESDGRI